MSRVGFLRRGSRVPGNSVHTTKICQRQAADQSQNGRLHGVNEWMERTMRRVDEMTCECDKSLETLS